MADRWEYVTKFEDDSDLDDEFGDDEYDEEEEDDKWEMDDDEEDWDLDEDGMDTLDRQIRDEEEWKRDNMRF